MLANSSMKDDNLQTKVMLQLMNLSSP